MIPKRIEGATRILGAPINWDEARDGPCGGLPVLDVEGVMISAWEPTPGEAAAIAKGAPVYLQVVGTAHPPVMLFVGVPPDVNGGAG